MSIDVESLAGLLGESLAGASTDRVTVTLPRPLAEAFRLLAHQGVERSVSAAATEALTDRLQTLLWDARLERLYREHPELRPSEDEVDAMAAEMGLA